MIYRAVLKDDTCHLPLMYMGDYAILSVPEANTTITVKMGESRFSGCAECPVDRIRRHKHLIIHCRGAHGGLICSGGDLYDAEITDILEDI